MPGENKYRYWVYQLNGGDLGYEIVFIVANDKGGGYIKKNGEAYGSLNDKFLKQTFYESRLKEYKEIPFKLAINLVSKSGKKNVYKLLGISEVEIKVTEEMKDKIITELIKNKALYEDCAVEMEDYNECFALTEQGIIGEFNGRFYFDEEKMGLFSPRNLEIDKMARV